MSKGKDQYDERRRLERENELLREQRTNERHKRDLAADETADLFMAGLKDFLEGKACLVTRPGDDGATTISFERG